MIRWTAIFFVIAIISGIFGFSDIEARAATIAQYISFFFIALFFITLFTIEVKKR